MTIKETIQIIDRLVFSRTGKHLSDVQEAVVKGAWQGQTYQAIADGCNHSESRVRDVGYKLWQILSEQLLERFNTRVVSVLGSAGIGKTTLVRYWLDTNTLNFDLVIWKNLKLYPSLS